MQFLNNNKLKYSQKDFKQDITRIMMEKNSLLYNHNNKHNSNKPNNKPNNKSNNKSNQYLKGNILIIFHKENCLIIYLNRQLNNNRYITRINKFRIRDKD